MAVEFCCKEAELVRVFCIILPSYHHASLSLGDDLIYLCFILHVEHAEYSISKVTNDLDKVVLKTWIEC